MKNETRKTISKAIKIGIIIASAAIIAAGIWHWRYGRSVGTDIHKSTGGTMADIKRANESARSEFRDSREHLERAEEYVNRAAGAVGRSEEAAGINARSADELQALISECKGIVEAQRGIIRDVDRANGIRPEENEQN